MSKYNSKEMDNLSAVFGPETDFNGDLIYKDSLRINGKFAGTIVSSGFLYIDEKAEVKAEIKVGTVIVAGKVIGNISASDRIEMLAGSTTVGDIKTPRLLICDGVIFQGKCNMIKGNIQVDIFKKSAEKLKKELVE